MEKRGKYLLIYSNGVSVCFGEDLEINAIIKAREEAEKDPGLKLVEITRQGGITIDYCLKGAKNAKLQNAC